MEAGVPLDSEKKPQGRAWGWVVVIAVVVFIAVQVIIPLFSPSLLIRTLISAIITLVLLFFEKFLHLLSLGYSLGFNLLLSGVISFVLVTGPASSSPVNTPVPVGNTPTIVQPTSTPVPNPETFKVSFTKGRASVTTSRSYDRPTMITVTGVATAQGVEFADAFYVYSPVTSPTYRADTTLWINGKPSDALVKPIPRYNGNHKYTFTLNASGGHITFGVGDVLAQDKTGSFTVTVV